MERKQPDAIEALFSERLLSQGNGDLSAPELPPDPFDALRSIGEIAAYVFHECGEDGLRQVLAHETTKEDVLDASAELESAGMTRAASIATEIAATRPYQSDLVFCSYPDEPGQEANRRAWQKAEERRQERRRSECELRRQQRFKAKPKN